MITTASSNFSSSLPKDGNASDFDYEGSDLEAMGAAENYPNWILSEFTPFLRGKVADVGAGSGNFSQYLLRTEIDSLHGFEPSESMHGKLAKRFESEERFSSVNSYVTDAVDDYREAFDTVVYNNVMEHVEDDYAELKAVYKMLRPGGRVLIYVPAMSWLYSEFDKSLGHFRRYGKSNGCQLLLQTGFSVEIAKYADVLGMLPWFVCMKLFKGKLSKGSVSLYDKVGVPLTRAFENLIVPPAGKNLLLVGRKDWQN
ncbi:Methyltransferase domain family [Verrucomicrobiia bacterium DG1235]|nr:Methyltransferase domain family [Verrucomicrobiae bacterium DG1235]